MSFGSSGGGGQSSRPLTGKERGEVFDWGISSIQKGLGYTQPGTYTTTTVPSVSSGITSGMTTPYVSGLGNWGGYKFGNLAAQPKTTTQTVFTPSGPTLPFASYTPWSTESLYDALIQSRLAPLMRSEYLQRQNLDQDLANRGIWSSGLAGQLQNDLSEKLAPSYLQAGGEASTQAYNTALEEKQRQYEAMWRPLEYLMGLYNTTGGAISSGSGPSGWQFSI